MMYVTLCHVALCYVTFLYFMLRHVCYVMLCYPKRREANQTQHVRVCVRARVHARVETFRAHPIPLNRVPVSDKSTLILLVANAGNIFDLTLARGLTYVM